MSKGPIRIGTRQSALAMWQARHVAKLLHAQNSDLDTRIVPISTVGDTDKVTPLSTLGGKGIFVRGLEDALIQNTIDIAVHSLKDVTSQSMDGLAFFAFLTPESIQDALVTKADFSLGKAERKIVEEVKGLRDSHRYSALGGWGQQPTQKNDFSALQRNPALDDLPPGCCVGTGSLRRIALLRKLRPDIHAIPIRGNIETRMHKVCSGELGAILLSEAGIKRMGVLPGLTHHALSPETFVPAPGQGVIVIQGRAGDTALHQQIWSISDPAQTQISETQLHLLKILGFDCQDPFGIWSYPSEQGLSHQVFLETSTVEARYYHFDTHAPATVTELETWVNTQLRYPPQ